MSHDERLTSMAIGMEFSDGMAAGSLIRARMHPVWGLSLNGVRPHSIWNQISTGVPADRPLR
jgi:hypothetical protein